MDLPLPITRPRDPRAKGRRPSVGARAGKLAERSPPPAPTPRRIGTGPLPCAADRARSSGPAARASGFVFHPEPRNAPMRDTRRSIGGSALTEIAAQAGALGYCREMSDSAAQAAQHCNSGDALGGGDRTRLRALEHYRRALELYEALGQGERAADMLLRIGAIHCRCGHFQRAAVAYVKALRLRQRADSELTSRLGYVFGVLGEVELSRRYHASARVLGRQARVRGLPMGRN